MLKRTEFLMHRLFRLAALCCSLWVVAASAQTPLAPAPYKLRVVGGLAGVSQFTRWEEPFWSRELLRLSGGRFSADIVPFDRAGVPGVEMLSLLQLGVVPFGTTLMSALSAQYPQYTAPDLAGLNPDIASLRQSLSVFRPYLEKALRDQHGVEMLAVYTYPAQVLFCKKPLASLADLAGRRIRVSSVGQADFIGALGAVPVNTAFGELVSNLQSGNVECAITGTMSGNSLGLPAMTNYVYAMPLTWGLAVFGANRAAWEALPPELRALLRKELPKLEASIWEEAARDTAEGFACNSGASDCKVGQKGRMVVVPVSAQDERRRQEVFKTTVLPRWLKRCGGRCDDIWNQTIGLARHIATPGKP
ncbi:TRAP transporter substrate-binding protein [Candidatus Aalborgicola defluviihabitans]|jgi:TRAP-type C4-dicarboxylate transport system substrate-binding protein|uniref:TRAP transporter substrate-binding protein n=2 Tax=Candidatus Aalborgicola defluviihabitans TaxID=3386187 RepID=UPI0039B8F624